MANWYIVHTYSNFEKKAAEEIKRQVQIQGLNDLIEEVMVPTEEVVEVRRGHRSMPSANSSRVTCWCAPT